MLIEMLLIATFVMFVIEIFRSRATNFIAWGLALWALAILLTRGSFFH